jgi:hypothetical protein
LNSSVVVNGGRAGSSRPSVHWSVLRTPAVEVGVQLAVIGVALAAVGRQDPAGWPGRTTVVLVLVAGAVAAVLLATAGWVSDNRRAVRIGGAVGVYAAVVLLPAAVGAGPPFGMWSMTSNVALLGVVGFLALAVRASADRIGDKIAAAIVVAVVALATGGLALAAALTGEPAAAGPVRAADLVVWSGTGAAALVVYIAGTVADRWLLRCTALAFATLAAANASRIVVGAGAVAAALQLAAVAMLLVVAVRFGRAEVGTVAGRRARLVEAEAELAAAARRDHELRDLAVGLSGAARVLTRDGSGFGPDDRRLLAATAAGFDRMRRIATGEPVPAPGAIGPMLRDLALVHQANGLDVRVEVDGDPDAVLEVGELVEELTALLVECAEQAPDARVWLRVSPAERRLRVEVTDGPVLAQETVAALVQRGGNGPRPVAPAPGNGFARRGTLTVTAEPDSDTAIWSAVLDLPVVAEPA